MPGKARTLFLGLDACDPGLVRHYAAAGELPTLARLLATGARARFDNEPGYFVGSVWPTLMTGTPVDRHHWYTGTRFRPEHYDYVPQPLYEATVWERCHQAGMRVAVFDAPHVHPVQGLNGVQVCEWGCHDRQHGTQSWPPSLVAELDARHGTHPIGTVGHLFHDPRHSPCDFVHRAGPVRTAQETAALHADLLAGVARKTAASLDLLDRGGWDLYYVVFGESHCVGHQLWHLHDEAHERHDPAAVAALGGDPLLQVYRGLDHAVGEHLRRLGPGGTAYVALSHGMQAHYDATHLLPVLLHRLGLAWKGAPAVGARTRRLDAALARLPGRARTGLVRAAGALAEARYRDRRGDFDADLPPLPERVFLPIDNNTVSGAVRLNLAGREARGVIAAADRERALAWLEQRLRELVNVATGRPAVADVIRSDRVYRHSRDDPLADLLVEWERGAPIDKVWSPAVGLVEAPYTGVRTGDHTRRGLLLASGPGLTTGEVEISPLDVVPVLAASLGLATPDLEGSAPPSLVPGLSPGRSGALGRRGLDVLQARADRRRRERAAPPPRRDPAVAAARRDLDTLAAAHHETRLLAERALEEAAQGRVAAEILATSAWVRNAEQPETALVSVVIATRNRRRHVMGAIDSVRRQSYQALEIVVVDDASEDDTWEHLVAFEDRRVRCFRQPAHSGTNAARNRGLDEATGSIVAYLDDDNAFDRDWLKAVVWAFEQHPDRDVLYGARIVDDVERHHGRPAGGLPWTQLLDWDRDAVRHANRVDINVLAHRRSPARFDESNRLLGDWDLVLQLTQGTEPLRLPVVAAYYTTDAPARMTTSDPALMAREVEEVRRKWRHG